MDKPPRSTPSSKKATPPEVVKPADTKAKTKPPKVVKPPIKVTKPPATVSSAKAASALPEKVGKAGTSGVARPATQQVEARSNPADKRTADKPVDKPVKAKHQKPPVGASITSKGDTREQSHSLREASLDRELLMEQADVSLQGSDSPTSSRERSPSPPVEAVEETSQVGWVPEGTHDADERSSVGSTSSQVGRCPRCKATRAVHINDRHQVCINCLGPDHPVAECDICQALPARALLERARRVLWWRNQGTPRCPSVRVIRNLCVSGRAPPACLEAAYVTTWSRPRRVSPVTQKRYRKERTPSPPTPSSSSDEDVEDPGLSLSPGEEEVEDVLARSGSDSDQEGAESSGAEQPLVPIKRVGHVKNRASTKVVKGKGNVAHTVRTRPPTPPEDDSDEDANPWDSAEFREMMKQRDEDLAKAITESMQTFMAHQQSQAASARSEPPVPTPSAPEPRTTVSPDDIFASVEGWMMGVDAESTSHPPKTSKPSKKKAPSKAVRREMESPPLSAVADSALDEGARPLRPAVLLEGQSCFDWDVGGTKFSYKEDLAAESEKLITDVEASLKLCALQLSHAQPAPVAKSSDVLSLASEVESSPQPIVQPIPEAIKNMWSTARRQKYAKPYKLVPPVTLQSFRVPPEDWAFLGAIRRPDETLKAHSTVQVNARQVPVLQHKEKSSTTLDSFADTVVQATAHSTRPLVHGIHAIRAAFNLVEHLLSIAGSVTHEQLALFEAAKNMLRLASSATVEVSEAQARLNSYALRMLRDSWVESSRLPDAVKTRVKAAELVGGVPPDRERVEFVAPLVGDVLQGEYEEAFQSQRRMDTLAKKAAAFTKKPAPQKRAANKQFGGPKQKQAKRDFQPPAVTPKPQAQQQSQGQRNNKRQGNRPPQSQQKGQKKGGTRARNGPDSLIANLCCEPHLTVGGRLQHFCDYWVRNFQLEAMVKGVVTEGYKIPFDPLPQFRGIRHTPLSGEYGHILLEEVDALLAKGAIEPVLDQAMGGFYSTYFLVPKKTGDLRPILNLKPINGQIKRPSFKMETVASVMKALNVGDWMASLDLKDAYFHIPIHPSHWKYLRFCYPRPLLSVQGPSIWLDHVPQNIHQGAQTCHSLPPHQGNPSIPIPGRHSVQCQVGGTASQPDDSGGTGFYPSRVHHQHKEVLHDSVTGHGFHRGEDSDLAKPGITPSREGSEGGRLWPTVLLSIRLTQPGGGSL